MIALDPVLVTDSESIEVGELLFEGLVGWKPGTTDIEPRLAERGRSRPTAAAWTFHLRDHVAFHDGTPFDADAVVFSFERLLDPKHPSYVGSDNAGYWRQLLKDVDAVRRDRSAHRRDPRQAAVRAAARRPRDVSDRVADRGASAGATRSRIIRSAPGRSRSSRGSRASRSSCSASRATGAPAPALERIVFEVVVDARQRLIDLESGSVDLATSILPDEQPFVELHPDLVLHHTPANDVSYLAFNTQHPPFDDVRVRRAANYAINKEPIVKLAYSGPRDRRRRAAAADAVGLSRAGDALRLRSGDGATKLLAEAAADGTFDPNKTYKLYALSTPRPYLPQPERVARFLQGALEQVGIHTELVLAAVSRASRGGRARRARPRACSAGSATPAIRTTSSTCCSRRDNANRRRRAERRVLSRRPRSTSCSSRRRRAADEHDAHGALRRGPGSDRRRRAVGADRALRARGRRARRARARRAVADRTPDLSR